MSVGDDDLEDGEIEDDDEEVVLVETAPAKPKVLEKSEEAKQETKPVETKKEKENSSNKEKSEKNKDKDKSDKKRPKEKETSKKRRNFMEDDFASSIESQLASVLKKDGVEPPLPSVKRRTPDLEEDEKMDEDRRDDRRSRKRKKKNNKKDVSSCNYLS